MEVYKTLKKVLESIQSPTLPDFHKPETSVIRVRLVLIQPLTLMVPRVIGLKLTQTLTPF